jgi:hypothetical protein
LNQKINPATLPEVDRRVSKNEPSTDRALVACAQKNMRLRWFRRRDLLIFGRFYLKLLFSNVHEESTNEQQY